ncbi:MAG: prolyl oligopeptidase family serine peptidase [Gemmatimonadota bacterium]|nr:MAG: prolyl oligopeptidase family serine peptidase [Gemmatimonadota bacterium]
MNVLQLCLILLTAYSTSITSEIQLRSLALEDGSEVRYGIAVPENLDVDQPVPMILALHHSWEGELPDYFGVTFLVRLIAPAFEELGAIIVAPDALERDWLSARSQHALWAVLDQVSSEFEIDTQRVVITGFSLGGLGAWYMAAENPDYFSAAIPIATAPTLVRADSNAEPEHRRFMREGTVPWHEGLRAIPLFVVHSRADELIAFDKVERAVMDLRANGASIEFVAVDGIGHYAVMEYMDAVALAVPWIKGVWSAR